MPCRPQDQRLKDTKDGAEWNSESSENSEVSKSNKHSRRHLYNFINFINWIMKTLKLIVRHYSHRPSLLTSCHPNRKKWKKNWLISSRILIPFTSRVQNSANIASWMFHIRETGRFQKIRGYSDEDHEAVATRTLKKLEESRSQDITDTLLLASSTTLPELPDGKSHTAKLKPRCACKAPSTEIREFPRGSESKNSTTMKWKNILKHSRCEWTEEAGCPEEDRTRGCCRHHRTGEEKERSAKDLGLRITTR